MEKLRTLKLYSSLKGCTRSKFSQRSLNFGICMSRKELSWDRNRILRGIFLFKWGFFLFHLFK